jgi:hypothetical protein
MSKAVVFVENGEQVRTLSEKHHTDAMVVSLTPEAEYCATQLKLEPQSILDFYDSVALMQEGSNNFPEVEQLCEALDRFFEEEFPGICTGGIFSTQWFGYHIKQMRDRIFYNATVLLSVFDRVNPHKVLVFSNERKHEGDEDDLSALVLSNERKYESSGDDLCQRLVLQIATDRRCEILGVASPAATYEIMRTRRFPIRKRHISKALDMMKGQLLRMIQGRPSATIAVTQMQHGLFDFREARRIWESQGGHVIDLTLTKYANPFRRLRSCDSSIATALQLSATRLAACFDRLCDKRVIHQWFQFHGIDCFDFAAGWVRRLILKTLPDFVSHLSSMERLFRKKQVKLLLCPAIISADDIAASTAARRCGAVVVTSQHGGTDGLLLPIFRYTDFQLAQFSFRYGPEGVRLHSDGFPFFKQKTMPKLIAVGSVPIKRIYARERSRIPLVTRRRRTLLYIPTGFVGNVLYFAWNHYPDLWYWHLLRNVLDEVRRYPGVDFLYKEYPFYAKHNPIREYVQAEEISNVRFISSLSPTEENLSKADLIVIDFPSTSLMGILCTRKPVILFCDPRWLKMADSCRDALQNRVELCRDQMEFIGAIHKWCERSDWPEIARPDDSFLAAFANIDDSLDPALKQVRAIDNILGRPCVPN